MEGFLWYFTFLNLFCQVQMKSEFVLIYHIGKFLWLKTLHCWFESDGIGLKYIGLLMDLVFLLMDLFSLSLSIILVGSYGWKHFTVDLSQME